MCPQRPGCSVLARCTACRHRDIAIPAPVERLRQSLSLSTLGYPIVLRDSPGLALVDRQKKPAPDRSDPSVPQHFPTRLRGAVETAPQNPSPGRLDHVGRQETLSLLPLPPTTPHKT